LFQEIVEKMCILKLTILMGKKHAWLDSFHTHKFILNDCIKKSTYHINWLAIFIRCISMQPWVYYWSKRCVVGLEPYIANWNFIQISTLIFSRMNFWNFESQKVYYHENDKCTIMTHDWYYIYMYSLHNIYTISKYGFDKGWIQEMELLLRPRL
jgi:hypothetical protein